MTTLVVGCGGGNATRTDAPASIDAPTTHDGATDGAIDTVPGPDITGTAVVHHVHEAGTTDVPVDLTANPITAFFQVGRDVRLHRRDHDAADAVIPAPVGWQVPPAGSSWSGGHGR